MRRLVPDQFHEPFRRLTFHLKDHFAFQCSQPIVHQEEGNEDCGNANRHKPLVADMARGAKDESFLLQLLVELRDERLERRPFESEPKLRDFAFEQLIVAQVYPVSFWHVRVALSRHRWSQQAWPLGHSQKRVFLTAARR
jgi:hypothetical protein